MAIKADIRLSVAEKEASKKKFTAEKDNIIRSLDRLQREVNNVQSWWKGESGAAFVEKFAKTKAKITSGLEGRVADYCVLMDATVDALLEADKQLAAKVGVETKFTRQAGSSWQAGLPPSAGSIGNLHVREAFESQGNTVNWQAGTEPGKSTITVSFKNGGEQTLTEGKDYYISDGRAHFYNNVRAILEANGAKVDFAETPGGGSTITVSMPAELPGRTGYIVITTLVEGKDYFIGADWKAHFTDMKYGPLPPMTKDAMAGASSVAAKYYDSGDYLGFKVTLEDWFKQSTSSNCSATAAAIVQQICGDKTYTRDCIMDKAWTGKINWADAGMVYSNPASEEAALDKILEELAAGRMAVYKVNGSSDAHWVTICGYQVCDDAEGPYDLRNFIIIDPADGQEKSLAPRYTTYDRETKGGAKGGSKKPAVVILKQE
jgi:uncharacterized protein YukE